MFFHQKASTKGHQLMSKSFCLTSEIKSARKKTSNEKINLEFASPKLTRSFVFGSFSLASMESNMSE